MRRRWRLPRLVLAGALSVLLAAIAIFGGATGYLAWRDQQRLAINEEMYVPIGGIDQWIQIRGVDRDNPALLWLNGGPGFSTIPATPLVTAWEKDFTVVMWDQRGEGRTFAKSGPTVARSMTMERMAQDGIEVAEYLRAHLHKDKIVLLGHSWGSMLGVRMAAARPDLFAAYVGTGQNLNVQRGLELGYPEILKRARAAGNTRAVAELESAGPPPYPEHTKIFVLLGWENRLDESQGNPSLLGLVSMASDSLFRPYLMRGAQFSQGQMLDAILVEDASKVATHFDVPIILIQGESDIITPTALVSEYFDRIEAPKKEFVIIPRAGHLAILGARDAFLKELTARVRPLAVGG